MNLAEEGVLFGAGAHASVRADWGPQRFVDLRHIGREGLGSCEWRVSGGVLNLCLFSESLTSETGRRGSGSLPDVCLWRVKISVTCLFFFDTQRYIGSNTANHKYSSPSLGSNS